MAASQSRTARRQVQRDRRGDAAAGPEAYPTRDDIAPGVRMAVHGRYLIFFRAGPERVGDARDRGSRGLARDGQWRHIYERHRIGDEAQEALGTAGLGTELLAKDGARAAATDASGSGGDGGLETLRRSLPLLLQAAGFKVDGPAGVFAV